MTGISSTSLQVVREILVRGDAAARQAQPERLAGEHVDLPSVLLDSIRMKVLTHDGHRGLELGLEPRRGVRKPVLGLGDAIVCGADHGVSMSPIHHSIAVGSRPTKRRKWRYQIEPLAVWLYMPMRLPARSAGFRMGPPRRTYRSRAVKLRRGNTGRPT